MGYGNHITRKHLFPAGEYVIGDPCYAIRDENWEKVLEETGFFGLPDQTPTGFFDDGLFIYKNSLCFAWGTAWGDGSYKLGKTNIVLGVDAGLISIMPKRAVDENGWLTTVVYFTEPFKVWFANGIFHFGTLSVNTK